MICKGERRACEGKLQMTLIWEVLEKTLARSEKSHKWPKEGWKHGGKVTNLGEVQTHLAKINLKHRYRWVGGLWKTEG